MLILRYLLFLTLALRVSAQETMIREVLDPVTDTHVEVLALFSKPSTGGFFPVRVKISNNLKSDRRIHLDFESSSNYGSRLQSDSSFTFNTPGGKTTTHDIIVPLCPPGGYYGGVNVSVTLSGTMGMANNTIRSSIDMKQPSVLLSESLYTPNASTLDSTIAGKYSSGRGSSEFAGKFDPKQVPDDWLAYSGYDSILMTDRDWSNTPPGGRNAILSWLRLGGQLVIYTTSSASKSAMGLPAEEGFGDIQIKSVPSDLKLDAGAVVNLVTKNPIKTQQTSIREDFSRRWPLQTLFGAQTFRYALFIIVLVIFAILVGPVNLFVFAKSGQRHKLFITTPIISLAASLILIALIIVQDGFGGKGMRRVLMEVRPDGGVNAAYLHQEQFCRTGVLTGSDFTISPAALMEPVMIASSRWARFTNRSDSSGTFNLQPVDGKIQASGDWFQSRSEQGHILTAVISTRGRIEKTDTPGTYLSTFEFPIDTLYFLDTSSQWQRADNITAGKRFTPVAVEAGMAIPELNSQTNAFSGRNQQLFKKMIKRPDHFVAITRQAPGIDTSSGIDWQETQTIITGPLVAP